MSKQLTAKEYRELCNRLCPLGCGHKLASHVNPGRHSKHFGACHPIVGGLIAPECECKGPGEVTIPPGCGRKVIGGPRFCGELVSPNDTHPRAARVFCETCTRAKVTVSNV